MGLAVVDIEARLPLFPVKRADFVCKEEESNELVRFIFLGEEDFMVVGFAMVVSGFTFGSVAFFTLLTAWPALLGDDRVVSVSLLRVDRLDFHFKEDVESLLTCVSAMEALRVDEAVTVFEEELRGAAVPKRGMLG